MSTGITEFAKFILVISPVYALLTKLDEKTLRQEVYHQSYFLVFCETPTLQNSLLKYRTTITTIENENSEAGPSNIVQAQEESAVSIGTMSNFPTTPTKQSITSLSFRNVKTPKSRKDLRNRGSLLKTVGVTRKQQLTPKARKLYRMAAYLRKTARRIEYENIDIKERFQMANKFLQSEEFLSLHVNQTTCNFIMSQIQLQKKKPKGRRYNIDSKLLGLSIMKQSPKAYRFLGRVFALPSRRTLMQLLNEVPLNCGINECIMENLTYACTKLKQHDKFCTIMFDEMSLEAGLSYNTKTDTIEGFENCGHNTKAVFADHVLVFMAKGLCKKWKQPLAYFFTEGGMKSPDLERNLKEIIRAVRLTPLEVVAVVCDQLSVNRSVIRSLKEKTNAECIKNNIENRYEGFLVDGIEVVPLYDPPHLLKALRNNLLQYDAKFKWKEDHIQTASWKDIVQFYEIDVGDYDTKMCYKLTDAHVYADHMKKMKVYVAAQIFSHSVSASMRALVRLGLGSLPASCSDTADFLLFVDKLFDSVNGSVIKPQEGKPLSCAISKESQHLYFWNEAKNVLKSMTFVRNKKDFVPPSVTNFIVTVRGLQYIWEKLNSTLTYLCLRNFNQDPLENFFGSIRSHGARNINPTPTGFMSSFKSLLVTNLLSTHSPGSNCEEDASEGTLDNLKNFVDIREQEKVRPSFTNLEGINVPHISKNIRIQAVHSYIAGYVMRSIRKITSNCLECATFLKKRRGM